ncbi:MAG: hypothetical protein ACKVQS_14550 [Fimbriimonadaceae bacterium]
MISFAFVASLSTKFDSDSLNKQQFLQLAWEQYRPIHRGTPFKIAPDLEQFTNPGELDQEFSDDATNFLKFVRLTAGLNANIVVESDLSNKAQWGANLLRLNGTLDHRVPKPDALTMDQYAIASQGTVQSNSSKFYGRRTDLVEMIFLQVLDDRSNVWNVGHRRWFLNPYLKKIGLGFVQSGQIPTSYGTIFATDQSGDRDNPPPFVAWPSPNAFPLQFCTPTMPWSVTLNPNQYQKPIPSEISITLHNTSINTSWQFKPNDNNSRRTDSEFTANFCGKRYGFGPSLIFRPDKTNLYIENGEYEVTITGLKTTSGEPTQINYRTRLFKLGGPVLLHESPLERSGF